MTSEASQLVLDIAQVEFLHGIFAT